MILICQFQPARFMTIQARITIGRNLTYMTNYQKKMKKIIARISGMNIKCPPA